MLYQNTATQKGGYFERHAPYTVFNLKAARVEKITSSYDGSYAGAFCACVLLFYDVYAFYRKACYNVVFIKKIYLNEFI